MRFRPYPRLLFFFATFLAATLQAEAGGQLDFSAQKYADEARAAARIGIELEAASKARLGQHPKREFHFQGFYETGARGDKSIEPDLFVLRFHTGGENHFWLGRSHPLREGSPLFSPNSTDAIGARWLQNQSNALEPSVVGWIGAGWHYRNESFFFTIAGTPFYFPSFGPRTELSEHADATGSRFARLPPQYVRLNGRLVPLRFHVDRGNLKDIVLQSQGLFALGFGGEKKLLRLSAWSSPTLNPEVDTSEVLRVTPQDLDVLVTAKPKFPRRTFFAITAAASDFIFRPRFDAVYESTEKNISLSQSFSLSEIVRAGGMHQFRKKSATTENSLDSPEYAEALAWLELGPETGTWRPILRHERHFARSREGSWTKAELHWSPKTSLNFFTRASVLTGKDKAYFGTWRALDSLEGGMSFTW
jgi:hypothetical protein